MQRMPTGRIEGTKEFISHTLSRRLGLPEEDLRDLFLAAQGDRSAYDRIIRLSSANFLIELRPHNSTSHLILTTVKNRYVLRNVETAEDFWQLDIGE